MTAATLECLTGKVDAKIGDRFRSDGGEWEIVGIGPGETMADVGPQPNIRIRWLGPGRVPRRYRHLVDTDGCTELCGDTVAAVMLENTDGKPRSARGHLLTWKA